MTKLTRRDVIKAQAVAAAAAAAGLPLTAEAQNLVTDASITDLKWSKAACRFCGTGCSIMVATKAGRVVATHGDAEAEVIEAEVLSTSPLAGKRITDIDFPEGVLVGMVRKGDQVIRPLGTTRIDEGDVIAVFCLAKDVPQVEQLMQVSIDFF